MHRFTLSFLLMLLSALPAMGQTAAQETVCYNNSSAPDAGIDACARLIRAGRLKGFDLATAYHWRGHHYRQKRDFDRAIADFSQAARITPNYISAFVNRARSYEEKGDLAKAVEDYTWVYGIDPFPAGRDDAVQNVVRLQQKLAERDAADYKSRALAYEARGEFEKALAEYRSYLGRGIGLDRAAYDEAMANAMRLERMIAERSQPVQTKTATAPPAPAIVAPPPAPEVKVAAAPPADKPSPAISPVVSPSGRRVALVIGNANYRHAGALANPANDAGDIAEVLRKLGFDVVDGLDLDKRGMEDKIREFGRKLDRAELALFFYAGHGMQVAGKNYLMPVDSRLERPGDLNFETIDVSLVLAQMEAEQRVNLVLLDACRNNPLARSFASKLGARSASVGQGLAGMQSALGTLISYATHPDAVALDGEGRNSPFTSALLKHLATPGLEIATLMRRVRAEVVSVTRGQQVPWDHSSLLGEVVLAR